MKPADERRLAETKSGIQKVKDISAPNRRQWVLRKPSYVDVRAMAYISSNSPHEMPVPVNMYAMNSNTLQLMYPLDKLSLKQLDSLK